MAEQGEGPPVLKDEDGRDVYVYANLAWLTGLRVSYLRTLNSQSMTRHRDDDTLPADLPPPDVYVTRQLVRGNNRRIGSRTPGWLVNGPIKKWLADRAARAEGERACTT